MDCLVAITDKLNAEAPSLLPPSLYEALCSINNETNENDIFAESVDSFTPFSNDENDAESGNEIFYVESDSDNLNFNSDYSQMKNEQNNCDSLKKKQKSYGDYFNKRSSVKNFSIGEQVVLLIPDSSNKIYARWTGPGEIIQHHPPHSYKVKLLDGTVRHVHVNKIRKYHPRALAVGVIFEDDHEFGEIHPTPNLSRSTSERVLHETYLNHLKETEREQVLAILLKHRDLFTSDVKLAKVGAHRIRLKPNIERKKPFLYRIPESLKIKVDEQIEELLLLDLIEESDAEIAYPIVCVNKKDVVYDTLLLWTASVYCTAGM
ncbi:retrovirus-related Pol polyprotein from transposon 17.6 [Trichonephila clavata]|uniref:Retrovirus-related Pol polyprotein from transposon 17.6 n=1 Tax=Trichonephila clavata TaxID=2740835 RepID=A0A8X6HGS0_TRICU|nr:retrovirus-related Pol polyprotein from transposon 17.6 [Trichonephila clavata]